MIAWLFYAIRWAIWQASPDRRALGDRPGLDVRPARITFYSFPARRRGA